MKLKIPGLKILDLYIIRKFLGTYFFAIGLIMLIVVVFDYVEKMGDFTTLHAPFRAIVFDYILNFIPYFLNQFSGLFTFIAVIFFTSKLAYQTEIIAMLSGGMSFNRLMWPYFLSAATIAVISLTLSLYIIPPANLDRYDFEMKYLRKNQRVTVDENINRQIAPGMYASIRGFDADDNTAKFLTLETYEGNRITGSLEASPVTFDPKTGRWSASRYTTWQGGAAGDTATLRHHDQRLDTLLNIDASEFGRVEKLVEAMNINQLNDFIRQQKIKGSNKIESFEVERAQRFSYPFSTFILTLIGVSLSSRKVRGGTGLHIGVGITLCFGYIVIARFAQEFAKNGVMPPAIAVWIPNILFALIAVYLYRKAPK
jgi:lipopolysaccharide export system permease protein